MRKRVSQPAAVPNRTYLTPLGEPEDEDEALHVIEDGDAERLAWDPPLTPHKLPEALALAVAPLDPCRDSTR
jgi:hypothetical protein